MANQHVKMCENMELTHVLFPRLEILIPISPKKADLIWTFENANGNTECLIEEMS